MSGRKKMTTPLLHGPEMAATRRKEGGRGGFGCGRLGRPTTRRVGEKLGSRADEAEWAKCRGGAAGLQPEQRKENTSFSFFISNFPNAFSNINFIRF
jgi:hypothetical protein